MRRVSSNFNSISISFRNGINASRRTIASWLEKAERNFPRLFNIVFVFVLPFVALLCWALFCGHFLAVIESESELQAHNERYASHVKHQTMIFEIRRNEASMERDRNMGCLDQFMSTSTFPSMTEMINGTELRMFMKNCVASADDEVKFIPNDPLNDPTSIEGDDKVRFHWNRCTNEVNQWKVFEAKWYESYLELYNKYTEQEGLNADVDEVEASIRAAEEAKGNDACKVNTGGGGIFWFTIMTTIGYGKAVPSTNRGRWFVMILGFPSILMFTAALGAIGYISLTIVDDLFHRLNMARMTKGWIAAMFWFCIFVISLLLLVGVAYLYYHLRGLKELQEIVQMPVMTFIDSFWFAFMTMTTVGLGDIALPHETFDVHHMFTIPIVILMGFVSLANFLLKLSNAIWEAMVKKDMLPRNESLKTILKSREDDAGDDHHEIEVGRKDDYDEVAMCDPNRAHTKKEDAKDGFLPAVRSIENKGDRKFVTFDPRSYGDENSQQDSSCRSPALRRKEGGHDSSEEMGEIDECDKGRDSDMKKNVQEQDCFPVRVPYS